MTQLTQTVQRALADPRTQQSFDTLDRYQAMGTLDPESARRLLRNNARDHTKYTPAHVRDAVALALWRHWCKRNSAAARLLTQI